MKEIVAQELLRTLARRYALARKDADLEGTGVRADAEMQLLSGIARNDLGASFEEWTRAIWQAREEIVDE